MKINEVEQLNEGLGDWARAAIYNTLGIGGQKGNQAATMYHFIDGFKQQLGQTLRAAKSSGLPVDYDQIIDSYLNKYGWYANPQQKEYLKSIASNPTKLAKAMYAVGVNQFRDKNGTINDPRTQGNQNQPSIDANKDGKDDRTLAPVKKSKKVQPQTMAEPEQTQADTDANDGAGASAFGQMARQLSGEPQLSASTQKLISQINSLKGASNLDDLVAVAKSAMQTLYAQNKEKYNELYQEITTGQKAQPEPQGNDLAQSFAAKRIAKQKAAIDAINGPQGKPEPSTADDIAAKRIAKQKAAIDAIDGKTTEPEVAPSETPPTASVPKVPGTATVRGRDGQALPTSPSMKPFQIPGARTKSETPPAKASEAPPQTAKAKRPARKSTIAEITKGYR